MIKDGYFGDSSRMFLIGEFVRVDFIETNLSYVAGIVKSRQERL